MKIIRVITNILYFINEKFLLKIAIKIVGRATKKGISGDLSLKEGFLPLLVHYYSPIPDLEDLEKRKIWDYKSELVGIDFRKDKQLKMLKELGESYGHECKWPKNNQNNILEFHTENPSFGGGCAAVAHSIIRYYKPNLVIEIGSGYSSKVINDALNCNREEIKNNPSHIIVDPYPSNPVITDLIETELTKEKVELLEFSFFDKLKENDILFIDSGHAVKMGGDVIYLYLEILPRLAPGVIIHSHDIRLPSEYAKNLSMVESFRYFWTEQYLLQSFLCFNNQFEILLALNYLMVDHKEEFVNSFPYCSLGDHPSSFWIKKKTLN